MFKKIILLTALSLGIASASFAATATTATTAPTMADNISISAASIEGVKMGPLGQANPSANEISTEVKFNMTNNANTAVELIAATSPAAQEIQLHQMIKQRGQIDMQQIHSITVKAHSTDSLSYQGVHVMLMDLARPLVQGEKIPVTLVFADGSHSTITAKVS